MYYIKIKGWFGDSKEHELYKDMVNKYKGGKYVEVGCWLGRSTTCLAEHAKEAGYKPTIYAVDTWQGSDEDAHRKYIHDVGGPDKLYDEFIRNIDEAKVRDFIIPMRYHSVDAAKLFDNESIDFVFIDGDHHYDSVKEDIAAWLPKVKRGGTIAGHDYDTTNPPSAGLVRAVKEAFGEDYHTRNYCWVKEIV